MWSYMSMRSVFRNIRNCANVEIWKATNVEKVHKLSDGRQPKVSLNGAKAAGAGDRLDGNNAMHQMHITSSFIWWRSRRKRLMVMADSFSF